MSKIKTKLLAAAFILGTPFAHAATVNLAVGPNTTVSTGPCGSPPPAPRAAQYTITAPNVVSIPVGVDAPVTVVQPLQYSDAGSGCGSSSKAYGQTGVIGIQGTVIDNSNAASGVSASARIVETDITIAPQLGRTYIDLLAVHGADIRIQPNLRASGSVSSNSTTSFASLTAFASVSGVDSTGTRQTDSQTITAMTVDAFGQPIIGSASLLQSGRQGYFYVTIPQAGVTPPASGGILVDPRNPISFEFSLTGRATAGRFNVNQFGEASFSSFNSLTFSPDGPAFFVPEGYTVNAPSLGIFDNKWIDPRIEGTTLAPVPLPAGGWMMLSALGLLVAGRKAKKVASS